MEIVASIKSTLPANHISCQHQDLPEPMLYYIKKNADPKLQLKLMQTSKYFRFKEFPYFVIKDFEFISKTKGYAYHKSFTLFELDITKISKKLWLTGSLSIECDDVDAVSQFIENVAVCEITSLSLNRQLLTVDEFKFLCNELKQELCMFDSIIINENFDVVPLENILENVTSLEDLYFEFDYDNAENVTTESTNKIIKALSKLNLSLLYLSNIPENFDIDENRQTRFVLKFDEYISDDCVQKLRKYVDKLLDGGLLNRYPVLLEFQNQNYKDFVRLVQNMNTFSMRRQLDGYM
uniref:DUF38 domain-containing protein n=1 Tax=Panagrolaimus sp. ES5 TaxID=591445 RepID=A0AC34GXH1_9BILA